MSNCVLANVRIGNETSKLKRLQTARKKQYSI